MLCLAQNDNVELVAQAVLQLRDFCARRNYDNLSCAIRLVFCLSFSGKILGRFIPMMAEERKEDEEQSKKTSN